MAAMLMRIENIQRHSLNHYFEPVRTLSDLLTFWLLTGALVFWAIQALGLTGPETDTIGLFVLTGAIGGIIAWPLHGLWLRRYLLLIREYGSASIDEILADIRRQAGD
jgi:Na+/proline symporter